MYLLLLNRTIVNWYYLKIWSICFFLCFWYLWRAVILANRITSIVTSKSSQIRLQKSSFWDAAPWLRSFIPWTQPFFDLILLLFESILYWLFIILNSSRRSIDYWIYLLCLLFLRLRYLILYFFSLVLSNYLLFFNNIIRRSKLKLPYNLLLKH